ncbi:hypothetical protein A2U01_0091818, partial [Trifolium medium]|nr:hypothetical protein [Trifolium medium]
MVMTEANDTEIGTEQEPTGFLEPSPVHRFRRFTPVHAGSERFLTGFTDFRFWDSFRTVA